MGALLRSGHLPLPGCRCRDCRTWRRWAASVHRRQVLTGLKLLVGIPAVAWATAAVADTDSTTQPGRPRRPTTTRPGSSPPAQIRRVTAATLLRAERSGRLGLSANARTDLHHDRVDDRLLRLLAELLDDYRLHVSVLRTGHTKHVDNDPAKQISQHYYGQAADISAVDGRLVRAQHAGARRLVLHLAARPAATRPTELGHPFALAVNARAGIWTDAAHSDHLHLGVRGMPA